MTRKFYSVGAILLVGVVAVVAIAFYAMDLGKKLELKAPVAEFLSMTKEDMRDGYAYLGLDFAEMVSYEDFEKGLLDEDFQDYTDYSFDEVESGEDFDRPNEGHLVVNFNGEGLEEKRAQFLLMRVGEEWKISAFGFEHPEKQEFEVTVE